MRTGITVDLLGANGNRRAGVVVGFFLSERKGGKGRKKEEKEEEGVSTWCVDRVF